MLIKEYILKPMKSLLRLFLLLIVFSFLIIHLEGQNNLKQYYNYVNQAELAICSENYFSAAQLYEKAFIQKKPFGKDLKNAYIISCNFLNDKELSIYYAHQLFQRGFRDLFEISDSTMMKDVDFYQQLAILYDTTVRMYDLELEKKFESLASEMQMVRYYCNHPSDSCINEINKVDRYCFQSLMGFYQNYPEISDCSVGYNFYSFTQFPFLNFVQSNNYNIQKILYQEVLKGNFDATRYMELEDIYHYSYANYPENQNSILYGASYANTVITDNTLFILNPENIEQINSNRKAIYVAETWDDYLTKVTYQFKYKKFFFYPVSYISYGNDNNDKLNADKLKSEIDSDHFQGNFRRIYIEREETIFADF